MKLIWMKVLWMAGCWSTILTTIHKCSLNFPLYISRCIYYFLLRCKNAISQSFLNYQQKVNRIKRSTKKGSTQFWAYQSSKLQNFDKSSQGPRQSDLLFLVFQKKNHPHVEPLLDTYSNRFHISWLTIENPNMLCFGTTKIPYFPGNQRCVKCSKCWGPYFKFCGWFNSLNWIMPCFNIEL